MVDQAESTASAPHAGKAETEMDDHEYATDNPLPVMAHPPVRVPYADGESNDMPLLWAEKGLRWLYKERRQTFADMMLAIMDTGFTTKSAPKNGSNGR